MIPVGQWVFEQAVATCVDWVRRLPTKDAQCIVELCHDVGIQVWIEGVETEEQNRDVLSMQLDLIQGV